MDVVSPCLLAKFGEQRLVILIRQNRRVAKVGHIDSPKLANQKSRGGDQKTKEDHLTIETTKEISMAERQAVLAVESRLKDEPFLVGAAILGSKPTSRKIYNVRLEPCTLLVPVRRLF